MYNSFSTVNEIISATPALNGQLINAGVYWAHRPKGNNSSIPVETLEEHVELVLSYFNKLVDVHHLDAVIDKLIWSLDGKTDAETGNYIKLLFVNTIVFHDYGKINERFQTDKMENLHFKNSTSRESFIGSTHSALGAYLYLIKHIDEIIKHHKSNPLLITVCIHLSYAIFKHHNKQFVDDCIYTIGFADWKAKYDFGEVTAFLNKYVLAYQLKVDPRIAKLIGSHTFLDAHLPRKNVSSFSLYGLCRLNFSLLTAADYLATNDYMNQLRMDQFGTLTKERIDELYSNVSSNEWLNKAGGKINYNKAVFDNIDVYELKNPKDASGANLNVLRQEMAIEVLRNIRKNYQCNLFYIEAPTGGGKTNLSALAAMQLLKIYKGQYNKVFYVFPFTTLITQTYKSLKETLGLGDEEMVELHSKAGMKVNDSEEDDNYGNEKRNYINNLFVNFPFVLLSHIRFFDVLKTNEKEANYLLHRLANSIVIIDELQSYNPQHWDKVIYFVKQYADKFNIKFILMSATLPKLDKLDVIKEQVQDFVYLLPNAKELYFKNPNFAKRVTFDFTFFDRKDLELTELASKLVEESKAYANKEFGTTKPLGSVYTIIEFIFKKTATEFYQIIKNSDFFDEIFVLSGTILEHRRRYIINFLKNKSNRQKKILLVTTQVVEAGVDIDMDLGFKDRSLIDSDEQLAGRINRNVNKQGCKLFLFNYNKEAIIYGNDKRLKLTRDNINAEQYHSILKNKDFDTLYDLVLNDRNELNKKLMLENFSDYENKIKALKFRAVHEDFKLIDQNNISCFVPLSIPIEVDGVVSGEKERIFSDLELSFLRNCGVTSNQEHTIEGDKVFDIYLNLIHNKTEFIKQKTFEKILQGIMSKFIFSLFANPKIETQIVHFSDEEKSGFGYQYIERWYKFYDVETGMRDTDFNSNETQFL